jgi:hypothetical protein
LASLSTVGSAGSNSNNIDTGEATAEIRRSTRIGVANLLASILENRAGIEGLSAELATRHAGIVILRLIWAQHTSHSSRQK